ncbi:unnamed protein product [Prorocentrum cordatum]|uniref:Uncharacterized protein n=1 Tax=Prorocentrum cordatum TaxID=2364126 RepID=A0ABN9X315_9DINO|nr:unnamed protein product [Polarella glacialis]
MRRDIALCASVCCLCGFTGWIHFNFENSLLSKWRVVVTLSETGRVPASLQSAVVPSTVPARIGSPVPASGSNSSQLMGATFTAEEANFTENMSRPASLESSIAAPVAAAGHESITDPLKGQSWSSLSARPRECVAANNRHVNGRSALHLHLHNYGGTFQCALAQRHGECTNPPWCNFEGCSEMVKSRLTPCWKRLKATHYTWIFEERGFNDDDISCTGAQIVYVILRDPLAALESTLNANHFVKSHVLQAVNQALDGRSGPAPSLRRPAPSRSYHGKVHVSSGGRGQPTAASPALDALLRHDGCLPRWDHYHHFRPRDHFAVRSLGGPYDAPLGSVGPAMLLEAKRRLLRLDGVLILEEMGRDFVQLEWLLGWKRSVYEAAKVAGGVAHRQRWTPEEAEQLRELNRWDYELFEFGQRVALNLTRRAVEATKNHISPPRCCCGSSFSFSPAPQTRPGTP